MLVYLIDLLIQQHQVLLLDQIANPKETSSGHAECIEIHE